MNELLVQIPSEKKLHYDAELIDTLYREYQTKTVDDSDDIRRLHDSLGGRKLLLVGPGRNIVKQKAAVEEYIQRNKAVVIGINWIPDGIEADFVYVGNSKRYNISYTRFMGLRDKLIGLSNIATTQEAPFGYVLNYCNVVSRSDDGIEDDSLTTAINAFRRVGYRSIALAGFDGFRRQGENSYHNQKDVLYEHIDGIYYNNRIGNRIREFRKDMEIVFVTDSVYDTADG